MSKILISQSNSPMFKENIIYRPFHYPWADQRFDEHEKIHWVASEVELSEDATDWNMNMDADEKAFIRDIAGSFTTGDCVVGDNYKRLLAVIRNNECSNLLTSIASREATHQKAYAAANDIFGFNENIFSEFMGVKLARERIESMYIDPNPIYVDDLAYAFALNVIDEGVSLFAQFGSLLHFARNDIVVNGRKGRLSGFSKINAWSLRDETHHSDTGVEFFNAICREHPSIVTNAFKKRIYDLARDKIKVEIEFVNDLLNKRNLKTLTFEEIEGYIYFVCNRVMRKLGLKPVFDVPDKNPCKWIEIILTELKVSNFFETRVASYQVGGQLSGKLDLASCIAVSH